MPRGPVRTAGVDNSGAGKQGYCKLCAMKDGLIQNQLDERTRMKWSPKQLNTWLETKVPGWVDVDRMTFYKHRKHVMHPQDRIVTAVQKAEQRALQTVPESSPDAFLGALVSLGHQKAIDNPEEVTIDHALRAASTLKQSKDTGKSGLNVLIALFTGNSSRSEPIEAEYVDVS